MDVHVDDSYFESEEQACEDSEAEQKRKEEEKKKYCARRCELNWFVEPSFSAHCTEGSSVLSESTACSHRGAQSEACTDFMLLKYRGDLYYSLKDFTLAAQLFEQVLELLPPMNAMVKREVTDSLARCYRHLGDYQKAKERAAQLVLPPYDSDPSSWKLLSRCQKSLGECDDHVISLQKCVALERQHADFWLALAEGYRHFKETCTTINLAALKMTDTAGNGDIVEQMEVSNKLDHILSNTVSLFRPYFTWRLVASKFDGHTEVDHTLDTGEPAGHLGDQECDLPVHSDAMEMKSDSNAGLSVCHEGCPFYSRSRSGLPDGRVYSSVLSEIGPDGPQFTKLCPLHSPFVMLASREVTVEQFIELLRSTNKANTCHLLSDVCSLSEISCHLWARQLLIYSARYSSSFAKVAMTTKLQQVEDYLNSSHQPAVDFLLHHFSQRTVFENSSKQES